MAEEAENLTIRLLQEIRGDIGRLTGRVDTLSEQVADLKLRIDGNTVLLTLLGGMAHDHERRITKLEGGTTR